MTCLLTLAGAGVVGGVGLCEASDPPDTSESAPAQEAPPTLDELLGLDDQGEAPRTDEGVPVNDPSRNELDRKLDASQVSEAFVEAVGLMDETAHRISSASDTGITTQRLQEEILRKLDQILASAQESQSSSSSSSSDPQQDQPDQQQQNNQQRQNSSAENSRDAPPQQDGTLLPSTTPSAARWGALRGRVRDALTQGTNDPFSALYRSMTEAYYKRLAEEASR